MELIRSHLALSRSMGIGLAGLLLGGVTLAGQSVLQGDWNRLANSGAIWLLFASLVGSRMPTDRWAIVAGVGVLVGAVIGYYAAAVFSGAGVGARIMAIWIGTALIGGPVYGLAGRWCQAGSEPQRVVAIGLMGGILAAEGVSTVMRIPDMATVGWVELAAGVALMLALGRSVRERLLGLAVVPVILLAGVLAYAILDRVIAGG
jgi:hypothetical protein